MSRSRSPAKATAGLAVELRDALAPHCERIEIAGSVRRGKPDPHDIELVAIPRVEVTAAERDMFADTEITHAEFNHLDDALAHWKAYGEIADRRDKNGRPAWGQRFKRCLYDGVALDIFSVLPPAQFGVIFAIRTGPADFSREIVTSRLQGGYMPVGMQVQDGALWVSGGGRALVPTPEEEDFFGALELPVWEPRERSVSRLLEWKRARA